MDDDDKVEIEDIFLNKQGELGVFSGKGDIIITFSVDGATIGTSLGIEEARVMMRGLENSIDSAMLYEDDEECAN